MVRHLKRKRRGEGLKRGSFFSDVGALFNFLICEANVMHKLIEIKNRTLDVVFSRFISISFTITLRQRPKGVTRSRHRTGSLSP